MNIQDQGEGVLRFGNYQCDLRAGELYKNGIKVKLSDQPFRLLAFLLERRGTVVSRQELRERLWPTDEYGDFDDGLNTAINKVRAALSDSAENPRFIETIPRRGYRFIAPVETTASIFQAANAPDHAGIRAEAAAAIPANRNFRPKAAIAIAGIAAIFLMALAGAYFWKTVHDRDTAAADHLIRSIAVLPFENLSGDPAQDYFADGITDELTTNLAQLGSLSVTSRASTLAYRGIAQPIRQIRRDLGVDAVVEGSVIRSGSRVRVDARLVETVGDRQIWAESFTQNESDIVSLEDDLAQAIAARVQVAIDPSLRERLASARPVNPRAYEAYLHGMSYLAHHSNPDLLKSLDYFKQAAAIDPMFASAYAMEAEAYCYLGDYSVLPDNVVWPQAEMAAQKALDLDGSIEKAHAARAFALWRYEWNWKDADAEFEKALALNPNDADTHHLYAIFLATESRFREATEQIETARKLDPLSLIIRTNIGWLSYYQRNYADAISIYRSVLRADPKFAPASQKLWIAYALNGQDGHAAEELDDVFHLDARPERNARGSLFKKADNRPRSFRAELLAYANSGLLTDYERSRFLALAGERTAALQSLEEAKNNRSSWLVYAGVEPAFDPLRSTPQFRHLLAAIGVGGVHSGK